ncbi:MAG: DUF748 domain-containing protein [Betaproteobacteria bacterium]|nr:DUF748 domain-containing protein [Betaproteobacteria bacterium]
MQLPFSVPAHWLRRARWALGGLLLVWVLTWLAVPPLAKHLIEEKGSAALGRKLTVGDVAFRPWSLEVTLSDIAVAAADGKATQLHVDRVYLDGELESLLRLAPVLDAVTVDGPTLRLSHQGDGRYDVDDILETLAKASAAKPPSAPLPFALYNLTLNGGSVDFSDHLAGGARQHTVRGLHLAVPFLSTLSSKRDIKVQPRLAFDLNGSQFDTAAEGTPFAQTHKGDAALKISHLDLAPYLPYVPKSLPVRLQGAVVDADLRLAFEAAAQPKVKLSGSLGVSGLTLADHGSAPLLAVESIQAELADVRPLERVAKLASLTITAPKLQGARNRAGRINLQWANAKETEIATKSIAPHADSTRAGGKKGAKPFAGDSPWTLALEHFALHRGELVWADDSTPQPARLRLVQLEVQAQSLHWPLSAAPISFEGSASIPSRGKTAQLAFKGQGSETQAKVHASLGDVELNLAAPYLAQFLEPAVQGVLDAELDATWQAAAPDGKAGDALQLAVPRLSVRDFALKGAKEPPATATNAERAAAEMPRFKQLEITDAQFDVTARTGRVGTLALRAPSAMAHRDAQGQWKVQRWLKAASAAAQAVTAADAVNPAPAASKPAPAWQIGLGELAISDGSFRLDDRSLARPARLDLSALQLQLKNATLDGAKPAPLTVSARVKSGRTEPGTLKYSGTVMWAPVAVQGNVDAVDIPLHAVAPYLANQLNIAVLRADASYKGQARFAVAAAGPEVQLQGDAVLEDFRANTVAATAPADGSAAPDAADLGVTEELLSWKSLNVPGIALAMAPGTATRVQVREATLSDFYARIIVNPSGRLNLQDLAKTPATAAAAGAVQVPVASAGAPALAAQPAPSPSTLDPVVIVGPIRLLHGKVLFSDRFIRPNYSADLSELNGTLSQFSSKTVDGAVQLADLELRGRAEGTATLEITGKVNPLAQPLALDINGRVRDLDLPPLTAYSIKYAGYGIERGKLSMDVNYAVKPDGTLAATNNLVLNQLTFGDKVEGAPNSLPVKLAVALLADRNGVIDINLPISGSLNDPQFRIGAVVWKVITNLVAKALTAPFALLARAFGGEGGGEELSAVAFAPGSNLLTPQAAQGLDKIAQALADRPSLHVTVTGTASLAAERDALRRERLRALMLAEKRRRAVVTGQDTASAGTLTEAEYPVLLKEVYRRADITKPRNIVGLAKDIPAGDMEALLLASIAVNEDAMHELALQRGVAVKDYLAGRKLAVERLFLGAAKTVMPDADWKPRAELAVTSR